MASAKSEPPRNYSLTPFLVREEAGLKFVSPTRPLKLVEKFPPKVSNYIPCETQAVYSRDGALVCITESKSVTVLNTETLKAVTTIEIDNVVATALSPKGTFVLTWQKPAKKPKKGQPKPTTPPKGNMVLWRVADGQEVGRFFQREYKPQSWPALQWTDDERIAVLLRTNEVHLFEGLDFTSAPTHKLRVKGITSVSVAPGAIYKFAVVVPEKKGAPAMVKVFNYPDFEESQSTATKSFFKAEEVSVLWNSTASAVLIRTSTDVDKTGSTYYGETGLHLLHADGSFSCTVPFGGNKGPVQDAQWAPSGAQFLVIQGLQPAKATMFRVENCTPVFEMGSEPRNTIRFSPQGRFVCLGGFGNLAGGMDFWDCYAKKKIGSAKDMDGAKSFDWAPDGRTFITAVLHPWRRVDNGYKIWSYAGELLYHETIKTLFQVSFQPALPGVFPDRPKSPRLSNKKALAAKAKKEKELAAASRPYVPPSARRRGGGGGGVLAAKMRAERTRGTVSEARKLNALEQAQIVGATAADIPQGPSKNKKKRDRKKKNKELRKLEEERKQRDAEAAKQAAKQKEAKEAADKLAALPTAERNAKRAKALRKKLRKIADLKQKKANGVQLDAAALQKLASEADLQAELDSLQ